MSGGLLEKAKQVNEGDADVAAAADAVIVDGQPAAKPASGLTKMAESGLLLLPAGLLLVVSLGLIYMFGSLNIDFLGWAVLLLLGLSFGSAVLHIQHKPIAAMGFFPQFAVLCVAYLVLTTGVWVTGWEEEGGGILLTDGVVHEDSDTVTLMLRHTTGLFDANWAGGTVQVSVTQDGVETWSGEKDVRMDQEDMVGTYGLITLHMADIYAASSMEILGYDSSGNLDVVEHPYTVTVTVDGVSSSEQLPVLDMARNLDDVDEEAYGQVGDNNCKAGYTTCVEYVELRGWAGIGLAGADDDTIPLAVRGEYTLTMTFGIDGDSSIDHKPITVVGTDASWMAGDCSQGTMTIGESTSAFLFKCGSLTQFSADIALSDDEGEREYGCYTMTLTATQYGEQVATSSSDYLFEDNQDSSQGDTYYSETFEAVSSC